MTLKQLEYILEVKDKGTVAAAAEALGISPAGLSKAVSELEAELGAKIFERTNKGSRPTENGVSILQTASEILQKCDELRSAVTAEKRSLRLVTYSQFSSDLLISTAGDIISASSVELSQKSVSESPSPAEAITDDLSRGGNDAAVISLTPRTCSLLEPQLTIQVLERSRVCAMISANSELASSAYLTPEMLRNIFFIPGTDRYFEDEMDAVIAPYKLNRYPLSTDSPSVIGEIVSSGVAARLCSEQRGRIDSFIRQGRIKMIPILKNGRYIDMNYICAYSPDNPYRAGIELFTEKLALRFG